MTTDVLPLIPAEAFHGDARPAWEFVLPPGITVEHLKSPKVWAEVAKIHGMRLIAGDRLLIRLGDTPIMVEAFIASITPHKHVPAGITLAGFRIINLEARI